MKKLLPAIILFLSAMNAYGIQDFIVVKAAIKHLHRKLNDKELDPVVISILKYSLKYNLDWKIMAAIISQESSFRQDPQNCAHIKRKCIDLGISQINYDTWKELLNLNRKDLLKSIDYNIGAMARILSILKASYGKEKRWPTRYHSFTRSHRKIYAGYIYQKYLRLDSFVKGYEGGYENAKTK